jgi:trans-L-3-hydroxyproline dehydratase
MKRSSPSLVIPEAESWNPPKNWKILRTIEAHTGGEPLRVIIRGLPPIPGKTMLAKRRYVQENWDHVRRGVMWEPRGHADMFGAMITEPVTEGADLGVLFLHNVGLSTMCGHGIIALATIIVETGMFPAEGSETVLNIDTPAGLVKAFCRVGGRRFKRVRSVRFHNVPSFVLGLDETVDVPGMGRVKYDLAFGGAFYAYVRSEPLGLSLGPQNGRRLIEAGMAIKRAIMKKRRIAHPFETEMNFLYGTIFIGASACAENLDRNVCIFAEGELDRSPTGTGVSGRVAIQYARGELKLGQPLPVESIVGSRFIGRAVKEVDFGPTKAVIPEVEGSAYITGRHEFFFDPQDPFGGGFIIR